MFLHWRANLADQNKQQPLKINIRVTYHTVLSVWNKPLIDTCQHCSTNRANQALRSLAKASFQNRGVCLQAFPSSPSPSHHFRFFGSCFISHAAKTENPHPRSFFAPKPNGNACYAGYTFTCKTDIWLYLSWLVLLLAFISSLCHLIVVKLIIVFLCFYNNKSRFSLGAFTVEPYCMQMLAF